MSLITDLSKSMKEESGASKRYWMRAEKAKKAGDHRTAALYLHIARGEDGHYQEFKSRREQLKKK
jgi:rubrerythrin